MNLQRKRNKLKGYQFYKDLSAEKEVPKWFMLMLVNRTIKPKENGFEYNGFMFEYGYWVIVDEQGLVDVCKDEFARTTYKKWEEAKV